MALAPMPPEKVAYALARYSRSPDSIEGSLRWVHAHSSEKFWEQFYFAYGHGSIADLGHVTICFENISELAAIHIEDEPLWDGQAKSSRYQNFEASGCYVPDTIRKTDVQVSYDTILEQLFHAYHSFHEPVRRFLSERDPKPDSMKPQAYDRTIAARTFDATRYFLPLASHTNVGQVVSIRSLEKQITRLLSDQLPELHSIGVDLKEACTKPSSTVWGELEGHESGDAEPLAPTLARYAAPSTYQRTIHENLSLHAKGIMANAGLDHPEGWAEADQPVDLLEPHPPLDEVVTTLLYHVSHAPYRRILEMVQSWSEKEKQEVIEMTVQGRGSYDDLPKEFRSGYAFIFDILMDIGGWRDLHRHRRCQQVQQDFTTLHGYAVPAILQEAGLGQDYRQAMDGVCRDIEQLKSRSQEAALYALPFGFQVRCLFKMDFAEAEYIARLRSGVKGHWSYRQIAWQMKEKMMERDPLLGSLIQATPPHVEEPLTR